MSEADFEKTRVKDVEEAQKRAEDVQELVGHKIDAEFDKLKLAQQFGLEEEVEAQRQRLNKLLEDAEGKIESSKWGEILKYIFSNIVNKEWVGIRSNKFDNSDQFIDFKEFLKSKFGPGKAGKDIIKKVQPLFNHGLIEDSSWIAIPDTKYVIVIYNDDKQDQIEFINNPKLIELLK